MSLRRSTLATLRFTPGFRPGLAPPDGPEALMASLAAAAAAPPLVDAQTDARLWAEVLDYRRARKAVRRMGANADQSSLDDEKQDLRQEIVRAQLDHIARAVETPHGFGERMARFWSSHFAVSAKFRSHASRVAGYEDQALRPNMTGRFGELLKAAVKHPAMLIYLDQNTSVGPNSRQGRRKDRGMNENLAREVLELHTLGVGGPYGQKDVQALAALLTGFSMKNGQFAFRPAWSEPGSFELLGARHDGGRPAGALAALDALAVHPATARHLSRKLAVHFVADEPPEALVSALERTWLDTGGDLSAVSRTLVEHPAAWGPLGAKARQPEELVVAALRAVGATRKDLQPKGLFPPKLTIGGLRDMGQLPNKVPGPDGWPEEAAHWITPGAMAKRLEWALQMGVALEASHDPRAMAQAALQDALSEKTAWAVAAAAEKREGFALLLASPDFNRR